MRPGTRKGLPPQPRHLVPLHLKNVPPPNDGTVDTGVGERAMRDVVARGEDSCPPGRVPCLGDRYGGGWALVGARCEIILLAGLLIALQFLLPSVAFAAPARLAPNPSSTDPAFARAEVSVVRLIVTYNTSSPPQSHSGSIIHCTGLGILVGSWLVTAANAKDPYVNWVLTDAALLNQSSAVCAPANTAQVSIASIDVLPNNVYTNTHPANTLGTLMCQTTTTIVCMTEGTTVINSFLPVNASAMLFSFRSAAPQPFVDIATQDLTSDLAIRLTNAGGVSASSLIALNNRAQNFLNPLPVPLNSNKTTTSSPTTSGQIVEEPGTPSVNAAGQVVSIQVGSGPLDVTQAVALLKTQPPQPTPIRTTTQPTNLHTNPLRDAWNKGIDDFYGIPSLTQPNYPAAAKEFRMAAAANKAFQAATTFAIASDNGGKFPGQGISTPGTTPTPGQTPTGSNLKSSPGIPWLLLVTGLFVLIILLVGIGLLARARAHQKELARFEADRHEAEMAAQRQQQARQAQAAPAAMVNKASTPPPRPTSLPCPHCGYPTRVDAPYCSNCHYVLSQSPSGHLVARPPTVTETPKILSTPEAQPQSQLLPLQPQQAAAAVNVPGTTTHAQTASDLRCPNCGRFAQVGATYCPNCRYQLSSVGDRFIASVEAPHAKTDTVGELRRKDERNDAESVGVRSIASSGPGGAPAVSQEQEAPVEATPENASVEARLRRLWNQSQ